MGKFDLKKIDEGGKFTIEKGWGLDAIRVELSWKNADLDAQAWLLNADALIVNDAGFVFYNSQNRTEAFDRSKFGNRKNYLQSTRPMSADGAVLGPKDELTGGVENIEIILSKIAPDVEEINITATIYSESKEFPEVKVFGQVKDAKITIYDDDSGEAICYYELNKEFSNEDACIVGRFIINEEGNWEFEAVGKGYSGGLQTLVDIFTDE